MYKDKNKQREAIKAATQRYRAKKGDSALSGSTAVSQNARGLSVVDEVCDTLSVIPSKSVIPKQVFPKATKFPTHKLCKDIKCFADLPLDVQETINKLSTTDGRLDPGRKSIRTAIAVSYQQMFPDRYHSTGVA